MEPIESYDRHRDGIENSKNPSLSREVFGGFLGIISGHLEGVKPR